MAVSTFQQTNFGTQTGASWTADLDGNVSVLTRLGDMFAPHQQATANMTAALDPGHVFNGTTLTEVAVQSTGTITAPASNPRIDRVVVDQFTGAVSVVTGTEAASPVPPAIPAGKMPVAQILLQTGSTAITNGMITDERDFSFLGGGITGVTAGAGLTGGGTSGTVTISLAIPVSVADGGTGATAPGPTAANNIGALAEANNLSDLTNTATARTNLGLGSMATQNANAVAITGGTITGLPTPTNPSDAATKAYVDATAQGLSVRNSVSVATAGALPNSPTYANGSGGVGATLTAGGNGALTVDGYTINTNDRLLVKDQAAGLQNGIYTVTNTGSGSAPYVLTRATDANSSANLVSGIFTFVEQGTINTGAGFVLTTPNPITVGTTALTFTQFSGAGEITAGTGLSKSGNTISLDPAGTSSIGGVEAFAPVAHQWINSISTAGIPAASQPAFSDISGQATLAQLPSIANNTVLGNNSGGTGSPSAISASNVLDMIGTTQGDILYRGTNGWAVLTPGTSGQVLQTQGTGNNPQWANANPGTVTSVGLSMPSDFTVSGSPVTSTGTLTVAYANENANTVLAGPASGSAAAPTWRSLVFADLPAGVAPLNSPALTGTPTAPTAASGTSTTQIATTAFVETAISGTVRGGTAVTNPMSANITLTSASAQLQAFVPNIAGLAVQLPDATTLSQTGANIFILANRGRFPVQIQDGTGALTGFITPGRTIALGLTSTSSSAGSWLLSSGDPSTDNGVSWWGSGTFTFTGAIAGYASVALSPSYGLLFYSDAVNTLANGWQSDNGTLGLGTSATTLQTTLLGQTGSRPAIDVCALSATTALVIYGTSANTAYVQVLQLDTSTLKVTAGTALPINGHYDGLSCDTISSSLALITFNSKTTSNFTVATVSVSGLTCTLNSPTQIAVTTPNGAAAAVLSPTLAHVISDLGAVRVTLSGTTATPGTLIAPTDDPFGTNYCLVKQDSTHSMYVTGVGVGGSVAVYLTDTGSTLTAATTVLYNATQGTSPGVGNTFGSSSGAIATVRSGGGAVLLSVCRLVGGTPTDISVFPVTADVLTRGSILSGPQPRIKLSAGQGVIFLTCSLDNGGIQAFTLVSHTICLA